MPASILLIDEDLPTVKELQPVLAREGYRIDHDLPGLVAIRRILVQQPDLVICGISGPDEGWRFCRRLLTFLDAPLLLLTSPEDVMGRAMGLDLGADDCMTKPVLTVEFVARVRALLRRDTSDFARRQRSYFEDGDLVVDLTRHEVRLRDEPVALTATEFRVLCCLVQHRGEVVPHQLLLTQVWGAGHHASADTIKQYIHHLRQKLEPEPSQPRRIVTRRGEGYMLQRLAEGAISSGLHS